MVILSSGFHRSHVTIAAREAAVRNALRLAITGAYPTPGLKRTVRALRLERGRLARLLERDEHIPAHLERPLFMPELIDEAARLLRLMSPARSAYPALTAASMRRYGSAAARLLSNVARSGDIYHFRSGFGHASVRRAKELGLIALCDHAAVHPLLLDAIVSVDGFLPMELPSLPPVRDPVAKAVLWDIDAADAIVLNSDFLKDLFVSLGYSPEQLHVVYLGVDQAFLSYARETQGQQRHTAPIRLLFAGRFDRAKGAHLLIEALSELASLDWELVVAGPVGGDLRTVERSFLDQPRVTLLGTINRRELARQMSSAPVFVFPSLSEGSARVVFEALACGCYVITTRNAGSIVEEDVHGKIVSVGASDQLAHAIGWAIAHPDRVLEVGRRNADLISERFTQADYGEALTSLYQRLAGASTEINRRAAHTAERL